jgi:hypothetical protein
MKGRLVQVLKATVFVVLLLSAGNVAYSKSTFAAAGDFRHLGINRGIYNTQAIDELINKGIASREQATAAREIYKSYHIEIVELPPRLQRSQATFFGEVKSTFTPILSGGWLLTEVELKSVALDQLGTPIENNARLLTARLTSGGWTSQLTNGDPVAEFPGKLTDFSRKALFSVTGLLRHAPGQPVIAWTSDQGEEMAQRLVSSLLAIGIVVILPKALVIPIATEFVTGIAADKFIVALSERFKANELRWGVGEEITDSLIKENPTLYQTLGERVWTDPRGPQAGCSDLASNWRQAAERVLAVHRDCLSKNPPINSSTCHQSQVRFALDVFRVADFHKPASPSEMTPDEILNFVSSPTTLEWELLGDASDEAIRTRAQQTANAGILVLAVRRGDSSNTTDLEKRLTKIAIILPGQMVNSPSWTGRVPNSASLAVASADADASYLNKSLAFAFSNGTNVRLYARKF